MPRISSLSNTATVANSGDWLVIDQAGVTKKISAHLIVGSGGGGGGGGGTSKVSISSAALGGTGAGSLSFFAVDSVCNRGLVSLMQINPSKLGEYDVEIYDAGSRTANKMLIAYSVKGPYLISAPWYFESASGSSMRIGVRNLMNEVQSFYLTNLRVEKFA